MLPLCRRMICRDTLKPIPDPFSFVVKNGMKMLAATSGGIPHPLSVTESVISPDSLPVAAIRIVPSVRPCKA